MKLGILGTRGIPNNYGGFEQFAERLSVGLVERGHEVWVYNVHNHPCRDDEWHGVKLVHCHNPENYLGVPGQFIYDLNCIRDSRRRDFDVILQLGYTSSSVWHRLLPRKPKIVTNMDGLEWKRSKYSKPVQRFLRFAERLAVNSSDLLVADSEVIREYLAKTYNVAATYIPYGADIFNTPDEAGLIPFRVNPREFFLLIARIQPDNHVEEIINGVLQSATGFPLLIIGNTLNRYGKYLEKQYSSNTIRFLGPIFDKEILDNLRYFSNLYFHGHSSGGTNPSLLEAMAASARICAHDNPFNREVLGKGAYFFATAQQISKIIRFNQDPLPADFFIPDNIDRITVKYDWKNIISIYEQKLNEMIRRQK